MLSPRPGPDATRLGELSPYQWKSGLAAWLGWLFDGLELHLYTLVATPLVVVLVGAASSADPNVKEKSAYIQAAFLVGWALGGAFFGRLGDILGRSRALSLTVLTYALCTGLCAFSQTWWQLMIFRFIAALGIGGEWAVGAALLTETWPRAWRPWMAAVLQTGVNLGILVAAAAVGLLSLIPNFPDRYVFLLGVLPAFMVFWIRRSVPEPAAWELAGKSAGQPPRARDLFRAPVASITLRTTIVCAFSLSAWWLFIFWHPQYLRSLLTADHHLSAAAVTQKITAAFFGMIVVSIPGNFAAGALAKVIGNRRAIAVFLLALFASMAGAFAVPRSFGELVWFWVPMTGFFSGVFGLFTMYLPPLFPTLLRTSGAGFCYNIGRLAAAAASITFGWLAPVDDFRQALFVSGFFALAAAIAALWLPAGESSKA